MSEEPLMTTAEIARRFRLSVKTIRTWTRQGRLPCLMLGSRSARYRASDVERALTSKPVDDAENA